MDAIDFHSSHSRSFLEGYTRSAAFRERRDIWNRLIERYMVPGGSLLDVGCGPGIFTCHGAGIAGSAIGIDGSEEMLHIARAMAHSRQLGNVTFEQMRMEDIPTRVAEKFDTVLCSSVLEYFDDLDAGLDILSDRVKHGGILIVSLPNAWSPYRLVERATFALIGRPSYYRFVKHVVTPGSIRDRLSRRNLTCDLLEYYGSALKLDSASNHLRPKAIFNNIFAMVCRKDPRENSKL